MKRTIENKPTKLTKPSNLTARQLRSRQSLLTIIDVRSNLEYWAGHIPDARCLNRDLILQKVPKDQPIAITCMSGHRSAPVAQWLVAQDYSKVYNLQGGLITWQLERYPIKRGLHP
ncbi:MAG: rhodanese-like domain-containing protein [Cyanobacteria bacterium P01_A01_bin.17]